MDERGSVQLQVTSSVSNVGSSRWKLIADHKNSQNAVSLGLFIQNLGDCFPKKIFSRWANSLFNFVVYFAADLRSFEFKRVHWMDKIHSISDKHTCFEISGYSDEQYRYSRRYKSVNYLFSEAKPLFWLHQTTFTPAELKKAHRWSSSGSRIPATTLNKGDFMALTQFDACHLCKERQYYA